MSLFFNKSYDYHLLKVFGCECWPYIRPYNYNFSYCSKSCVLGYIKPHVGYICFHPLSGRVYIAWHVVFNETNFPFSSVSNLPIAPHSSTTTHSLPLLFAPLLPATPTDSISVTIESSVPIPSVPATSIVPETPSPISNDLTAPTRTLAMTTRAHNNIHHPKPTPVGFIRYPLPQAYINSLDDPETKPTSFTQEVNNAQWHAVMAEEFNALLKNDTWTLVPSTSSMNLVGSKWVF